MPGNYNIKTFKGNAYFNVYPKGSFTNTSEDSGEDETPIVPIPESIWTKYTEEIELVHYYYDLYRLTYDEYYGNFEPSFAIENLGGGRYQKYLIAVDNLGQIYFESGEAQ